MGLESYGHNFLEHLRDTNANSRKARLAKIETVLAKAVPQLTELGFVEDRYGRPHLQVRYVHWRPKGHIQTEDQFLDGTLRLIYLLWAVQDGRGPLLLEEPELSLHLGVVGRLPGVIRSIQRHMKTYRQVIISTHSAELLSDDGIGGDEVLMLTPDREGTLAELATDIVGVRSLLDQGFAAGDVVMPHTEPRDAHQLTLSLK